MATGTNDNEITWSALPSGTDPTYVGFFTTSTGTGFIGANTITSNVAANTSFRLAPGALDINYTTGGDLVELGRRRAIAGVVDGGIWVSLHDGNPGNGGANEVSGGSYVRKNVASADISIT